MLDPGASDESLLIMVMVEDVILELLTLNLFLASLFKDLSQPFTPALNYLENGVGLDHPWV